MNNKKIEEWKLSLSDNAHISVANKVKTISPIINQVAKGLSNLEKIQYVRISTNRIEASNEAREKGGGSWKQPITDPGHQSAIGISLDFDFSYKTISVYSITSAEKGNGSKIVESIINGLDAEWKLIVVMDWSSGFWDKMVKKYPQVIVY